MKKKPTKDKRVGRICAKCSHIYYGAQYSVHFETDGLWVSGLGCSKCFLEEE